MQQGQLGKQTVGFVNKILQPFVNERLSALVVIGAILFTILGHEWPAYKSLIIDWLVVLYFAIEFFAKAKHQGLKGYFSSNANRFDFFVLVSSFILLTIPLLAIGTAAYLRALRLVSMLRALRLVPNAGQILQGLKRALSAARAVLLFMFTMMVVFAILGYSLFSQYLPEFFGTPLTALNTVFGIFTVENWGAVPEAAAVTGIDWLYYAVNSFVITVLILGGFIALSLANAIFVDEMVSDNNDEIIKELAELKKQNQEILEQLKRNA